MGMDDLDAASEIMVQAFIDGPMWTYLVPDGDRRRELLHRFYHMFIRRVIESGEAYGVGRPLQGVAVWVAAFQGDDWAARPSEMAYLKMLSDPLLSSRSDAVALFSTLDRLQRHHAPGPHFYLSSIGVVPEVRGRGIASRLIRYLLAMADARSLPVYTETVKASNVDIYKHYGFTIVQRLDVQNSPLTIWALVRGPRSRTEKD